MTSAFSPPSYDGTNIVNLMASIVAACGGRPQYAELESSHLGRMAAAQHIVLIVIDGLGSEYLEASAAGSVMRQHVKSTLSSVFPPTTATAITTYLTGLAPRQHGLTGWYMYFRELGSVVTVLPFTTRLGSMPLTDVGVSAPNLLGHVPVFDQLDRTSFSVSPLKIANSEFNLSHIGKAELKPYESMPGFFTAIADVVRSADGRSFTYAYWSEFDHLGHLNGINSPEAHEHLAALDAGFDELLHELRNTDTMVLVTADHGFVDIPSNQFISVSDHPELQDALRVPLCGEPRAAYCYVSPDHSRAFVNYVDSELSEYAVCVESVALIEAGYYGPGPSHPQLASRVGDFTLLMRDGYAIQHRLPGEDAPRLIGMHGGGSTAELHVPLIVTEV